MSPKVTPKKEGRSSYQEFRSRSSTSTFMSGSATFWNLVTAPTAFIIANEYTGELRPGTIAEEELRVLSRATNAGGGYTVPTALDSMISTVRRSRSVIAPLARNIETDTGHVLNLGTATTHGTGTWAAENAAFTLSDETFGQGSVSAFKASTAVIVSEELA